MQYKIYETYVALLIGRIKHAIEYGVECWIQVGQLYAINDDTSREFIFKVNHDN